MSRENEPTPRGELVRFGLLVVVLAVVVLGMAVLRPLIFDRIVPAVMGEGQPMPVEDPVPAEPAGPVNAAPAPEGTDSATGTEAGGGYPADAGSMEVFIPAAGSGGIGGYPADAEAVDPEALPTAVPTVMHVVQAGENLTAIAQQYGVTVAAILEANRLPNPDNVQVGMQLLIPQP